jgi:hypothetical protein
VAGFAAVGSAGFEQPQSVAVNATAISVNRVYCMCPRHWPSRAPKAPRGEL